jgi:hypothetical protein
MKLDPSPRSHLTRLGLALAVAVSFSLPSVAHAEEVVVVQEDGYRGPEWRTLSSGLFVFAGTYTASLVVAATSSHPGDQYLWAPIVGPWLDIAHRCSGAGPCDNDTGRKVLLGFDGVFQGLGLLSVASSFLMSSRRSRGVAERESVPQVHVLPVSYARGAPGLAVVGTF